MIQKCIVCDKEFDAVVRMSGVVQRCCSSECRKEHKRKRAHAYNTDPYNRKKQNLLYKDKTQNRTVCKLCGKPTVATDGRYRSHFHDECLLKDAVETIKSGKKFTSLQYSRLNYRGYSVKDIKDNIKGM